MQDLPHIYQVKASAETDSNVYLDSDSVARIESAAPAEFGGPGDRWSPETLLVAAVADCFVLTFKAIARNSKLDWIRINCDVKGKLDKIDRVMKFVGFDLTVNAYVPAAVDQKKVHRLLEMAEQHCLITNSLTAETSLHCDIHVEN